MKIPIREGNVPKPTVSDAAFRVVSAAIVALMAMLPVSVDALPGLEGQGAQSTGVPESRAELLAALRQAKAGLRGAEPNGDPGIGAIGRVVGTLVARTSHIDNAGTGLSFVVGGHQSQHGLQAGIRYTLDAIGTPIVSRELPNRTQVSVQGLASVGGYTDASAWMSVRNLWGSAINVAFGGGREHRRTDAFYGLGPDTSTDDLADYGLTGVRGGTEVWWENLADPRGLKVGVGVDWVGYEQDPFEIVDMSIGPAFGPGTAPGIGLDPRFVRWRGFVTYDRRDLPAYPRAGAYLAASFASYDDRRFDAFSFQQLSVDVRTYVPFWQKRRTIAVRALGEFTATEDGQSVPFYLLPSLGGPDDMRGLPTFRFRDSNKLLLQLEYRWEAWVGLDMAAFVDAGQVFEEFGDIDPERIQTAYGIGLRFKTQESLIIRADFAYGTEGFRTDASFNRIF